MEKKYLFHFREVDKSIQKRIKLLRKKKYLTVNEVEEVLRQLSVVLEVTIEVTFVAFDKKESKEYIFENISINPKGSRSQLLDQIRQSVNLENSSRGIELYSVINRQFNNLLKEIPPAPARQRRTRSDKKGFFLFNK